ncbi:MAG: TauD/TfdA family dioxygenase [Alphaproteobacteria bacterium]|nr:MAG: TauD/TfdA family dioxygenase [Alphaproteobacteria bacterium]
MSTTVKLKTKELMPNFGTEILNVNLATADDEARNQVVENFNRHGAILLRDQKMTPDDLMSFVSLFGEPENHTQKQFTLPGYPKIFLIGNKKIDGHQIGSNFDGIGWHTDYSYKKEPVKCTMLYAVEVPAEDGDTLLADLCAAYQALSSEKKKEFDGLVLHHSYAQLQNTRPYGCNKLTKQQEEENPDVFHPLIRTHPVDGRKALWVSTGTVKDIVGMPNSEGLKLIDELVEFATQDQFVHRHKWRVGDILLWDNRCTLHTGTLFDDTKYVRLAHRMWVKGDKPY